MKAMVYTKYGPPDVLQLLEAEKPAPRDDEVLIRVHAASVNPYDLHYLTGKPLPLRLKSGVLKPKRKILGIDIAGRIESVGRDAQQFQQGDEVFGDISGCGGGGFAEHVSVSEKVLALKPSGMTFEEAAAVPMAAVTALQGLRDRGGIQPGQKVLINGASGGVGTFAVQIAKSFGAEVTGVCSTRNLDMVRSIGADQVIDYTKEDFAQNEQGYDLILDAVGNRSVFDYKRVLSSRGTCVIIGYSSPALVFQVIFLGPWVSMKEKKKVSVMEAKPDQEDLVFIKQLFEAGKLVPVIDKRYSFGEIAEALRYLEEGHARGKVVITVEENN
jgi:NADPH:quinone reductase-like Zn-dependent oxidoreductase